MHPYTSSSHPKSKEELIQAFPLPGSLLGPLKSPASTLGLAQPSFLMPAALGCPCPLSLGLRPSRVAPRVSPGGWLGLRVAWRKEAGALHLPELKGHLAGVSAAAVKQSHHFPLGLGRLEAGVGQATALPCLSSVTRQGQVGEGFNPIWLPSRCQ